MLNCEVTCGHTNASVGTQRCYSRRSQQCASGLGTKAARVSLSTTSVLECIMIMYTCNEIDKKVPKQNSDKPEHSITKVTAVKNMNTDEELEFTNLTKLEFGLCRLIKCIYRTSLCYLALPPSACFVAKWLATSSTGSGSGDGRPTAMLL